MPATLEEIEKRLATVEQRLDRFDQHGARLDGHDKQLGELRGEMQEQRKALGVVSSQLERLNSAVTAYTMRFDAVDLKLGQIVGLLKQFAESARVG